MIKGSPIYLDSAATTLKPQCVIDTVNQYYTREYATVHRAVYELAAKATERYSNVRRKVKNLIGAEFEEEIVYTKGTTESLNLIAQSYGRAFLKPGDEIIISEMEHHSNIVPWQMICQQTGAVLKAIPITDRGELDLIAYQTLLSDRTKIVSIAHIANATGTINPIKRIIDLAHKAGAVAVIDGAQAAGHMPLDVMDLDADFYAFSGHKIYGPTGVGILYGKKHLLEKMPPFLGGGDMVETVTLEETTYQAAPLKFEAGTPMIAQVLGLGTAIDYIQSVGLDAISKWEQYLLQHATQKLLEIEGLKIIGAAPEKGPIISFIVDGVHPLDIGTLLSLKGVAMRTGHLCAQPTLQHFNLSSMNRISFAFYSSIEEIDHFVKALQESLLLLKPALSY